MPTRYITTDTALTSVADAIRSKGGTSEPLVYPTGFISAINAIQTGGDEPVAEKDVNFIDYDGTLLYSYTSAEISEMTSESDLPENPSHEGLIAQGWNWTLAQIKAQLTAMPDQPICVGQMYITSSGNTEIDVDLTDGNYLSPYLCISPNGTVTVDWGDNSSTDIMTGTSLTYLIFQQHVYASPGKYTIKISVDNGNFAFYTAGDSIASILKTYSSDSNHRKRNYVYSNTITSIRIGSGCIIGSYAFYNCSALEKITIPSSITSLGDHAFYKCHVLKSITIPSGVTSIDQYAFYICDVLQNIAIPYSVTSIGNRAFYCCSSLKNVTIPSSVTSIGGNAFYDCHVLQSIVIPSEVTSIDANVFYNCYSLKSVSISSGVTSIGDSAFYYGSSIKYITIPSGVTSILASAFCYCSALKNVTIPSSVTSIGNNAFKNCYGVEEYHFLRTTPPTLGTTVFSSIVSGTVIYVPYSEDHSILNAYKTASNWSTYASYMQEEPAAA